MSLGEEEKRRGIHTSNHWTTTIHSNNSRSQICFSVVSGVLSGLAHLACWDTHDHTSARTIKKQQNPLEVVSSLKLTPKANSCRDQFAKCQFDDLLNLII